MREAGNVFGMGKSSAIRYINAVTIVIVGMMDKIIKLPSTPAKWKEIMDGFEGVCGFPNVCGARDGTLIEIERPCDHEGWYCRKGYPAINVQGVVDHKNRFISCGLRPGCYNDKMLYNGSVFGKYIHTKLPENGYLLGDAGYQLFDHLLTPYDIETQHQTISSFEI